MTVNSSAVQADIRFDKNLVNIVRDEDTVEMGTRVFPRGAQDSDGNHSTMARAEWEVGLVSGNNVALVDPNGGAGPIQYDDQLNGMYLRKVDGNIVEVTDTFVDSPAQTVEVASVTGITAGDLIQFRANVSGDDLTSLTNPITVQDPPTGYGEKVRVKDMPDLSGAKNVVPNPFQRDWSGTLPDGWTAVGAPTLSKQTAAPYTALGGASIKAIATADGQGVLSPAGDVFPTEQRPFGSGYAEVWVVTGQVRVELVITTPTGTVIFPAATEATKATSSVRGQWDHGLGGSGFDLNELGATAVAVRVVQHGATAATFYVDAAQVSETHAQEPLVEGSGGTRLWQAANELLRTNSIPIVSYNVPLVDLEAIDSTVWAESALVVGGPVRIRDYVLNLDLATRILEVNRDYVDPDKTSIVISNKPDDLLDRLAAKPPPKRKLTPPPPPFNPVPNIPPFEPGNGPAGLPGCVLWLKADALLATLGNGDSVPTWFDSSGSGNHARQSTGGNQPSLVTNVLNGLPVVQSVTDDYLKTATFINPSLGSTLFVVMRRNGTYVGQARFLSFGSGSDSGVNQSLRESVNAAWKTMGWYQEGAYISNCTSWHITTLAIASINSGTPYSDGGQEMVLNPSDSINAVLGVSIGALYEGSNPADAQFAEIILFNTVLSAADRNSVLAYLSNKYLIATTALLPSELAPDDVSDLALWLKADALSLANNDPVSSWTDSSTSSNPATQATSGKQPIYKTNQVNGLPVVEFSTSGTPDFMQTGNLGVTTDRTIILVSKKIGSKISNDRYLAIGDANSSMFEKAGNIAAYTGDNSTFSPVDFPRVSTAAFAVWGIRLPGATLARLCANYIQGSELVPNSQITGDLPLSIGAQPDEGSPISAQFAEIIVYNKDLTDDEYLGVVRGLVEKYHITVTS
jgi:hypothetical protein